MEIERKYLVDPIKFSKADVIRTSQSVGIVQAYVLEHGGDCVRVRETTISDGTKYHTLTFKGTPTVENGFRVCEEYETPISEAFFAHMLTRVVHTTNMVVRKTRYALHYNGVKWELDVFSGAHAGLILAEVEVPNVSTLVNQPDWIGYDVTHISEFNNYALALSKAREHNNGTV